MSVCVCVYARVATMWGEKIERESVYGRQKYKVCVCVREREDTETMARVRFPV